MCQDTFTVGSRFHVWINLFFDPAWIGDMLATRDDTDPLGVQGSVLIKDVHINSGPQE